MECAVTMGTFILVVQNDAYLGVVVHWFSVTGGHLYTTVVSCMFFLCRYGPFIGLSQMGFHELKGYAVSR